MPAVAGVDDVAAEVLRDEIRRARGGMPHDEDLGAGRVARPHRGDQRCPAVSEVPGGAVSVSITLPARVAWPTFVSNVRPRSIRTGWRRQSPLTISISSRPTLSPGRFVPLGRGRRCGRWANDPAVN